VRPREEARPAVGASECVAVRRSLHALRGRAQVHAEAGHATDHILRAARLPIRDMMQAAARDAAAANLYARCTNTSLARTRALFRARTHTRTHAAVATIELSEVRRTGVLETSVPLLSPSGQQLKGPGSEPPLLLVHVEDHKGRRPRLSPNAAGAEPVGAIRAMARPAAAPAPASTRPAGESSRQQLLDSSDATTRQMFEQALAPTLVPGGGGGAPLVHDTDPTSPKSSVSRVSSHWKGTTIGGSAESDEASEPADAGFSLRDFEVTVIGARNLPKMDRCVSEGGRREGVLGREARGEVEEGGRGRRASAQGPRAKGMGVRTVE
jgi:hypothetical protein